MNAFDFEHAMKDFPKSRIKDIANGKESIIPFPDELLCSLIFAAGHHHGVEVSSGYRGTILREHLLSGLFAAQELKKRIQGGPAPAEVGNPPSTEKAGTSSRPTLFDIVDQIRCELGKLVDAGGPTTNNAIILRVMELVGGIGC